MRGKQEPGETAIMGLNRTGLLRVTQDWVTEDWKVLDGLRWSLKPSEQFCGVRGTVGDIWASAIGAQMPEVPQAPK